MIRKWTLAVMIVVVLCLSVVGTTVAQGEDEPGELDLMARIAESLDLSREDLLQMLSQGQTLREIADELGAESWAAPDGPTSWMRPSRRIAGEILADALGLAPEELASALRDGATIQELVEDAGLDPAAIGAAIKPDLIARIRQAVENGKLSEERAARLIERLEASDRIDTWLDGAAPEHVPPREVLRGGKRVIRWLRRHPQMSRLVHRFLDRWQGTIPQD